MILFFFLVIPKRETRKQINKSSMQNEEIIIIIIIFAANRKLETRAAILELSDQSFFQQCEILAHEYHRKNKR